MKNHEVRLNFRRFRPDWHSIKGIYQVGLPSIIMQSIGSVMTFGMNKILIAFTETAVSVFGVYFKLQSFVFMPVFGVTNALVPIVGYNYGARSSQRIQQATRLSLLMTDVYKRQAQGGVGLGLLQHRVKRRLRLGMGRGHAHRTGNIHVILPCALHLRQKGAGLFHRTAGLCQRIKQKVARHVKGIKTVGGAELRHLHHQLCQGLGQRSIHVRAQTRHLPVYFIQKEAGHNLSLIHI